MNNRLGDIPAWAMEDSDDDEPDVPSPFDGDDKKKGDGAGDIELANAQPKYMENFFRDVDKIKADIETVAEATKQIGSINEQALSATTTNEENELSRKLRPLVENTNKRAKQTKTLLGLLKEETAKLNDEKQINASDTRVRENLCTTLTRKFIDEMKLYQAAQQKYKSDIKSKVKRQVQIVKPDATDDEIDAVMKSDGGRDALYKERILAGGVNDQIKTTYAKVAGKYQDVLTLESSVAQLHQMFLDFALLTEQQGELLDQIEFQVKQAGDYVEEANVDVHEAIEYQKSIRKKQCWILILALICSVVLLFVLGVF
uniref:t-SNARE coiled-coil homology domain-containing protein n=1 Tax=Craspedostauros australis TaxID=1486917 RepID=A0A7R9ZT34_9STRA|mmetsp:Transcript_9162/g.24742  ORF Transcript_9162/g.24742 Transcript_9162/m.24742 type:complete len:315 (+) Transcript_9162:499-1443(+)|eukprot:CAMPEP_0198135112 /NCGR_PEP_ID=MMETSP1442-20131203/60422_1 /TAXON_ID= /ORGANISM="Craspedostauros australis, Strain CCMP3328" /LENGTH=314 /DNA_ID=CAMNT_0043796273 /DNA_START=485 /DNA_END=1429 /DNA_ORIENTATION=+